MQTETDGFDRYHRTQLAAYFFWEGRGRPIGDPEADWFRAEAELPGNAGTPQEESHIVAVAQAVGGAIGTVAHLVESVAHLIHPEQP